jgi:hypothetical protein
MVTPGTCGLVAVGAGWLLLAGAVRAGWLPRAVRESTDPDRTALAGLPLAVAGAVVLAMGLLSATGMVAGGPVWVVGGLLLAAAGLGVAGRVLWW